MKRFFLNTIIVLVLLLSLMLVLAACDNPFANDEDKLDPTLYKLTLSSSSNVTVDQADLKATYAYACKGKTVTEGVRPEDEIEALKDAGATQEDIDKAGKRQPDGSYYFFDADPMYIEAPQIDGYRFLGFFDKSTNKCVYKTDIVMLDGELGLPRWNMENRNVELEARYEALKYRVSYVDMDGLITNPTNPTEYDGSKQIDVELLDPTPIEGYVFKYWYYMEILFDGTENPSTRQVVCTKLPTVGNEGIIHTMGVNDYELTLFAEYEVAEYDVTFDIVDPSNEVLLTVKMMLGNDEEAVTDFSEPIKVKHGSSFDVWVDNSNVGLDYAFDGIYVNGVKIPDLDIGGGLTRPTNRETIEIKGDTTIQIKVVAVSD